MALWNLWCDVIRPVMAEKALSSKQQAASRHGGKVETITTIQRRVARVDLPAARDEPDGKDGKSFSVSG